MTARYTFTMTEESVNSGDLVNRHFETDILTTLMEEFLSFVNSSGYTYVEGFTIHKGNGLTTEVGFNDPIDRNLSNESIGL